MAFSYLASTLIGNVRRRAYLPVTGGPTDAAILAWLNSETLDFIVPLVMGIGDEYFVANHDEDTVAAQAEYDIPAASIGSKLRDVQILLPSSTVYANLSHTEPERQAAWNPNGTPGIPAAYFIQGNQVVLCPAPSQSGLTLRLRYYRRPDRLVTSGFTGSDGILPYPSGVIDADSTTGMGTVSEAGFFSLLNATTYAVLFEDLPGSVTDATSITLTGLTSAEHAEIASAYDAQSIIVTVAGDTPSAVPQLPAECVPLLEQRAAAMLLTSLADPRASLALAEVERVKATVTKLLAPRASGKPRRVVARHAPGWGGRYGGWS